MSEDVFLRVVEGEILRDTVFAVRHSARNVGYHVSALPRRRLPGDLRAHVLSPTSAGSGTCPPRGRLRNGRSSHSGTDGSNLLCSSEESGANSVDNRWMAARFRRRRSCPNCAQFVKEGKGAIKCTRLSCRSFAPTLFAFSFAPWRTTLATSCGRWRCRRRRSRGR
jgi:hypothetical protein